MNKSCKYHTFLNIHDHVIEMQILNIFFSKMPAAKILNMLNPIKPFLFYLNTKMWLYFAADAVWCIQLDAITNV